MLVAVVAVALFFDFTNGFHDTANSIATSVSTRALSPRAAVLSAAVLNFAGAFVFLQVAATVATGIVNPDVITLEVVLAGLVGAITWNLITWYLGLPSSSSHALIGGIVGSAIAANGFDVVNWEGLKDKVLIPSLLAPVLGLIGAAALMIGHPLDHPPACARDRQPRLPPPPARLGRLRRLHARHERRAEDDGDHRARAVTSGHLAAEPIRRADLGDRQRRRPRWRSGPTPAAGESSRRSGSASRSSTRRRASPRRRRLRVILWSTAHLGFPVSTTHTISGSVLGAGATHRLSAVRWGVAGNILVAWLLTIPCAARGSRDGALTRLPGGVVIVLALATMIAASAFVGRNLEARRIRAAMATARRAWRN